MTTGNLRLAFVIEAIDRATAPVRKVTQLVDKLAAPARKVGEAYRKLTSTIGEVGRAASLAGLAAAAGFVGFKRIADGVDRVNDSAAELGITTQQLQRMGYAAQLSGASQEELSQALLFLNKSLGEARGGAKETILWFNRVGITTEQLNRPGFKAAQAFEAIGDRFRAAGNEGDTAQKKISVATALMGRSSFRMIQFLNGGSEAMRKLYAEADRLGVVLSDDTVQAMTEFNDGWDRTRLTVFGAIATALRPAAVVLKGVVDRITEWTAANRTLIATRVAEFVQRVSAALPDILTGMQQFGSGLVTVISLCNQVAQALGGWQNVIAGVAALIVGKALFALYGLTTALWGLGAAFLAMPIGPFIAAAGLLAASGLAVYRAWGDISQTFSDLWDWIKKIGESRAAQVVAGLFGGGSGPGVGPSSTGGATGSFASPNFRVAAGVAGASAQLGGVLDINLNADGTVKSTAMKKAPGSPLDFSVGYNGLAMSGY